MKFVAIDVRTASVELVEADDLTDVYARVGLDAGRVDHGSIYYYRDTGDTLNIVVYEAGLFKGDAGRYFSVGSHLYEGGAVMYAADHTGNTVPLGVKPPIVFYRDAGEVERAIASGEVTRPVRSINGEVTWQWPEVRGMEMTKRETELMIEDIKRGLRDKGVPT
jgi:hypothetical protein